MHELLKLVIFAAVAFAVLYLFSRLLGKKQIAQLNFVDYVVGISFGSIAAEMAFDVFDRPFYHYIIAMAIFFVLDMLISFLGRKTPFLKRLLNGKPMMLIYEGQLDYKALKKSGTDINDLLSMMREQGIFDMKDIYYAIIEPSGKLSVMPIGRERPTVAADLGLKIEEPQLPNYLVIDGEISYSGLNELGKTKKWLFDELKVNSKKQLKEILLASYDNQTQSITTHKKTKN